MQQVKRNKLSAISGNSRKVDFYDSSSPCIKSVDSFLEVLGEINEK